MFCRVYHGACPDLFTTAESLQLWEVELNYTVTCKGKSNRLSLRNWKISRVHTACYFICLHLKLWRYLYAYITHIFRYWSCFLPFLSFPNDTVYFYFFQVLWSRSSERNVPVGSQVFVFVFFFFLHYLIVDFRSWLFDLRVISKGPDARAFSITKTFKDSCTI